MHACTQTTKLSHLKSADLSLHGGDVLGQEVDLGISLRDHLLQFGDILLGDEMGLEFTKGKEMNYQQMKFSMIINQGTGEWVCVCKISKVQDCACASVRVCECDVVHEEMVS